MKQVNILDARNNLSKLVSSASEGEEIVIANRGKPVARLVPIGGNEIEHTAATVAEWLAHNPAPRRAARTADELDRHIATEREGWE